MSQPPPFTLPSISDNIGGWGPAAAILPEQFRDIPYAPYSKADKLGRIADWSAPEQKDDRRDQGGRQGRQKYPRGDQYQAFGSGLANMFAYSHNEDESSFSVVDRSAAQKKMSGFRASAGQRSGRGGQQRGVTSGRGGYRTGFGGNTSGGYNRGGGGGGRGGRQQVSGRRRFGWKDYDKPLRSRDASVQVGPDWKMLDEIDFNRLSKLSFTVEEPEDLDTYGFLLPYDRAYDQIRTRVEKLLQHKDRVKYESTTSYDPVIQQLRQEEAGTVFATDSILALLMCAGRTVYPWDIVIRREGDQLIFDKRDGGVFDYITVNENTADPPAEASDKDNINSQSALSVEATFVNQNFAFQVVQDDPSLRLEFERPNPFAPPEDAETLASCAYRYRRFDLSSKSTSNEDEDDAEEIGLIVRTELDAYMRTPQGDDTYLTLRALNQFDVLAQGSGGALDWKKALDTQPGAVVATEMKNNSAKLARWAVQSYLAGAEQLRLGFITRVNPKDNHRHVILGTQVYKPRDFAASMNISISNGWGIVKAVVDMCLRLPEGKYVLVKDPNRPTVRIYSVPSGTFEEPEPDEVSTVTREE